MDALQIELNMTYWILAWSLMAAAFLTAFAAIAWGAHALDHSAETGKSQDSNPSELR